MLSTLQLTVAATVAIHLIVAVVIDAVGVVNQEAPRPPPLRISTIDLDTRTLAPPPRPAIVEPIVAEPITTPIAPVKQELTQRRTKQAARTTQTEVPPETTTPTPPSTDTRPGGGEQLYRLPDNGTDGAGPKMAIGSRPTGPTGSGGSGGGSGGGAGAGDGSGSATAKPLSVAAIKTKARPKGNYDYFDAGKSYPPAARQLGIEGVIKAKLIVDEQGRVTQVTLLRKLGHGLDELALARGKALEFDPARDADDRAVTSIVIWEFTFTLPR